MKRLMWGTVLSLIMLGSAAPSMKACDWKSLMADVPRGSIVINDGENTVWISSDEDTITVLVYDSSESKAEWM